MPTAPTLTNPIFRPVRSVWDLWTREPYLGVMGVAAALMLAATGVYLIGWALPAILAAPFIHDFQWYYEAAERYMVDRASTYDDPNFLYPPPSLLFFIPLSWLPIHASYLLFWVSIIAALVASLWLTVRMYERSRKTEVGGAFLATAILIGMAFGPLQQTLKLGQVTALVLLLGMLVLWASARRPLIAALALSAGFWLKLFPAALGLLGFRRGREVKYAVGLVIGCILLPIVLLPLFPISMYREYFLDLLPEISGLASMAADNHSLGAVLERLRLPVDARMTTLHVPITGAAKVAVYLYTAITFGAAYAIFFLSSRQAVLPAGLIIMAATPVILPLGWDHGFLAVAPLVTLLLLESRARGWPAQVAVVLIVLTLFVPKPPDAVMAYLVDSAPRPFVELVNARHLLATTAAIGLTIWWEVRRLRGGPSQPSAEGGS